MPKIQKVRLTPTISTGAYTTADAVGGLLTFPNIGREASAILQAVIIHDEDAEAADLDLLLFSQLFTATADKDALSVSDADILNFLGVVVVDSWHTYVASAVGYEGNLNLPIKLTGSSGSLFGQLICRSTPTYTATDDISVTIVLEK